jgi:hypothetical protein
MQSFLGQLWRGLRKSPHLEVESKTANHPVSPKTNNDSTAALLRDIAQRANESSRELAKLGNQLDAFLVLTDYTIIRIKLEICRTALLSERGTD